MIMPGSRGTFTRALSESGAPGSGSLEAVQKIGDSLASSLGCHQTVSRLACLRNVSAGAIISAQGALDGPDGTWGPTADGIAIPEEGVTKAFLDGRAASGVPLMLGSNTNDAAFIVYPIPGLSPLNSTTFKTLLAATIMNQTGFPSVPRDALERLVKRYGPSDTGDNTPLYSQLLTDRIFLCGSRLVAGSKSKVGLFGSSTFLYRYDYAGKYRKRCTNTWGKQYGVTHTAELSFVFEKPLYLFGPEPDSMLCEFTKEDEKFAASMGHLWARFASTGKPSEELQLGLGLGGKPYEELQASWRPYEASTRVSGILRPGWGLEREYRKAYCDLWDNVLYGIETMSSSGEGK